MRHCLVLFLALCLFSLHAEADTLSRHRAIILTDVENEPDDAQSLVRLLLYSDVIDLRGIVATTSTHMRDRVAPETIHKTIDAYAAVRPNLLLHSSSYPTAEFLHSIVKTGLPLYGMEAVGKGFNSEGSELIVSELLSPDDRPLWVCAWGGTNVLAQALFQLRGSLTPSKLSSAIAKLRIYTISDQDDSGIWIRKNFPSLFYIVSPGGYGNAEWGGMNETAPGADNDVVSNKWVAENVQVGHGPLGACYPDVAYGMEGDTPSFLSLIPNGLNDPEHPDYGGWGGRYELYKPHREECDPDGFNGNVPIEDEPHAIFTNAVDSFHPFKPNNFGPAILPDTTLCRGFKATIWRWRTEFQNDFAARLDWCVEPYDKANHAPVATLDHPNELSVKSGEKFMLSAENCSDPDGDNLSFLWIFYPEAGSYCGDDVRFLCAQNIQHAYVQAPVVNRPSTLHFILKVTDKGSPALSSYRRVIVSVLP